MRDFLVHNIPTCILLPYQQVEWKANRFFNRYSWVKPIVICLTLLFLFSGFSNVEVDKNKIELNADSHSFSKLKVVEGTHTTTVSYLVYKNGVAQPRLLNVVVDYVTPIRKSVSLAIAAKGTKTASHYVKITSNLSSLDGKNVVSLNCNKYSLQVTEAMLLCNIK